MRIAILSLTLITLALLFIHVTERQTVYEPCGVSMTDIQKGIDTGALILNK